MSQQIVVNQDILEMEYAVRGPLAQRAAALKKQGKPVIPCHIGNPQALGQEPISYYRQVLSLVEYPSRIERERRLNHLLKNSPAEAGYELVSEYLLDLRLRQRRPLDWSPNGHWVLPSSQYLPQVQHLWLWLKGVVDRNITITPCLRYLSLKCQCAVL